MSLERAMTLSVDLVQRRADLIRLFGETRYQERTALAKERIKEVMAQQNASNPLSAAVVYCRLLAAKHPGEDVSTTQQFVLCAAADLAEDK